MPILERELFLGLGGTGGNALRLLYEQMNEEQRRNAKYVYIDTDQNDIADMREEGIRTIAISNADTVRQVARSLGSEDGAYDWLPSQTDESKFFNSGFGKGASQCRFKSRLCLARFLKNGAPGLQELLVEMTPPGATTENNRLRVVIVSSVAGGTGAGTFIQMALYIRKFFRNLHQTAEIIGILSCPDLYRNLAKNETERISMYANAYAAIRELNAMNLATNPQNKSLDPQRGTDGKQRKKTRRLQGYGDKIHIKLRTQSEGVLFDSEDPAFQFDESAKPFDLIYFVDQANERGGILRDIHEYYRVMADIAYTRLYSPMNGIIESGESNELRNHTLVPTAIYGGAGYSRIIYPYKSILRYLAEQKLLDDLDARWQYLDSLWTATCEQEQDAARQYGYHWIPQPGQRGKRYREDLDAKMLDDKSGFTFLRNMIYSSDSDSRIEDFYSAVIDEATSLSGGQSSDNQSSGKRSNGKQKSDDQASGATLPTEHEALRNCGGQYCALRDSAVLSTLETMIQTVYGCEGADSSSKKPFDSLLMVSSQVETNWLDLASALENAVKTLSYKLAAAILPLTDIAIRNESKKSPISLHYALLSRKGTGDVHPLAARYLLYGLQELCQSEGSEEKDTLSEALEKIFRKIRLAFDGDVDDQNDITVAMTVAENQNRLMFHNSKVALANEMLDTYRTTLKSLLAQALQVTDNAIVQGAFRLLREPVDTLVGLYENFFKSIGSYQEALRQQVSTELYRHDSTGNQTIYVGASSQSKRFYAVEPSVESALNANPDEAYAAAGAGVYESLFARLQKQLQTNAQAKRMGTTVALPERFDDMSEIFDMIIEKYESQLHSQNTILNTDAFGAMVNESCAALGISAGEIDDTPANRQRFDQKLRERIDDLRAKARPMIRYNEHNDQKYYPAETEDPLFNVSKSYCHFGISPTTAKQIQRYYPSKSGDKLSSFRSSMNMASWDGVAVEDAYSDFEIFCFGAVHCLQPTQIYHFNESQSEESYYPDYKKRITSELESDCPHLDIRWNQRGAMPYISPSLELSWRKLVMKALLYEFLIGTVSFTVDRNLAKCFVRQEDDGLKFLYWPKGEQILTRNISRLVEYLSNDEERIELEAAKLDTMVSNYVRSIYNYAESPELYKQGMTKDKLLTLLRRDTVTFLQTERSIRSRKNEVFGDDEEAMVDPAKTMGGILHVAYLLHSSEERLGEDKDYGEALLQTAADIIDKYAMGMHGVSQIGGTSGLRKEYVDIYNWTIKKFFEEWLIGANEECRPEPEAMVSRPSRSNRLSDEEDASPSGNSSAFEVPDRIRSTPEYIWISNNWKYKRFQESEG
ncbi:MAG: tubulin-like doman-containing protein [Faecousia sp.]